MGTQGHGGRQNLRIARGLAPIPREAADPVNSESGVLQSIGMAAIHRGRAGREQTAQAEDLIDSLSRWFQG